MADKPDDTKEIKVVEHAPRSTTDLVILIAAIGVVIVNVVTAFHTGGKINDVQQQSQRTAERSIVADQEADKKLEIIHEQTNSNLTGVNNRLEDAYRKIEALEKLLLKKSDSPDEEKNDECSVSTSGRAICRLGISGDHRCHHCHRGGCWNLIRSSAAFRCCDSSLGYPDILDRCCRVCGDLRHPIAI